MAYCKQVTMLGNSIELVSLLEIDIGEWRKLFNHVHMYSYLPIFRILQNGIMANKKKYTSNRHAEQDMFKG